MEKRTLYNKLKFTSIEQEFVRLTQDLKPTDLLKDKQAPVVTFGSCFARNICDHLNAAGYNATTFTLVEYANSPMSNLAVLEHCILGSTSLFEDITRFTPEESYLPSVKQAIASAKCIVFTVGVGFVWMYDNKPFMVPNARRLDEFTSKYIDVADQKRILERMLTLIRSINPGVDIYLTLSPVPVELSSTYASPVISDCVSKSILRAAIHDLAADGVEFKYYPTFELFRWLSGHFGRPFYGADGKVRHVDSDLVELAVRRFVEINGGN